MTEMPNRNLSVVHGAPLESEHGLRSLTLAGFIREVCAHNDNREALVCYANPDKPVRWTYHEMLRQAEAVARGLIAGGFAKGTRVGVLMTNRAEWIAAAFGVALAGGVLVTLSTFATKREFAYFLRRASISVLLLEATVLKHNFLQWLEDIGGGLNRLPGGRLAGADLPFLERAVALDAESLPSGILSWEEFLASGDVVGRDLLDARSGDISEADEAVVFFSSGSTAMPKGIVHCHRAAAIQCWRWARLLELEKDVRSWTPNGFFWSGNFCNLLGSTLAVGGCVILQKFFEPASALRLLESERISYPFMWPHQMASLAEADDFMGTDLSSVEYVDPDWPYGKNPTVVDRGWRYPGNSFGCSETITIFSSFPASERAELRGGSNGVPLPGNTLSIVDPETGEPVPQGESGEIAIKGPTLMSGYLGIPLSDSLDANGFYRSGDGGYVDARGRLFWEGRLNDVIKTGGANVSPVEVDEAIHQFGEFKAVHTVGVPHATLGEVVVSCILPLAGKEVDEVALQTFLRDRLASYKRPRKVLVVAEEDLSFTATAKIKLKELRDLAEKRLREEELAVG